MLLKTVENASGKDTTHGASFYNEGTLHNAIPMSLVLPLMYRT